jgi:Major intrinsic protein
MGGAVNPARALGPVIVSGQLDDFWLHIIGPVIGGLLGAFVAAYVLRAFREEQDSDDESPGAVPRLEAPR